MLRQVYIVRNNAIIFERHFGKALSKIDFEKIIPEIVKELFSKFGKEIGFFDYYKYKISFLSDPKTQIFFTFIANLSDNFDIIKTELYKLKRAFQDFLEIDFNERIDPSIIEFINPIIDNIHSNLKPKISLIGFSGVGKTTITKLIKLEEIPMHHIPTINGEVATIKIGKLKFSLWDFAGQEQFSFLWNKFIKESDAVLLITNSTIENIEKSKYFLDLLREEAPFAYTAIIGNKQDLSDALKVDEIERILGLKTYSFVAIDPNNRNKMIQIIADILEIDVEISPLLKPLYERDLLINEARITLEQGDFTKAIQYFENIADLCINLGDDSLGLEFFKKSEKMREILKKYQTSNM